MKLGDDTKVHFKYRGLMFVVLNNPAGLREHGDWRVYQMAPSADVENSR